MDDAVAAGVSPHSSTVFQTAQAVQAQHAFEQEVGKHVQQLEEATSDFLEATSEAALADEQDAYPYPPHHERRRDPLPDFRATLEHVKDAAATSGTDKDGFLQDVLKHCDDLAAGEEARRRVAAERAAFAATVADCEARGDFEGRLVVWSFGRLAVWFGDGLFLCVCVCVCVPVCFECFECFRWLFSGTVSFCATHFFTRCNCERHATANPNI